MLDSDEQLEKDTEAASQNSTSGLQESSNLHICDIDKCFFFLSLQPKILA